jgi:putative tryptophan/tyrosine transport system substrate-binding protein
MRRREFIAGLGSAATTWPLAARAQRPAMPVIGYLGPGSPEASTNLLAAFRKGLSEVGYVEGRNVAIEFRWAHNENDRLPELAADLVRRGVQVIVTQVTTLAVSAAKAATTSIPVVFGIGADPVRAGLVASLNRPGGNVTGVTTMSLELMPKRLGLLQELLPKATRFAVLVNPTNRFGAEPATADARATAAATGRQVEVFGASSNGDIDAVFTALARNRAEAIAFTPDALFDDRRVHLATLAARHQLPALHWKREFAEVGGLMSYGSNVADVFRQTGNYAGRILNGEKPAELPVLRATKFEFVINLQTAKVIGIEIPPSLLALADEVIE